jgi:hypothetical protein
MTFRVVRKVMISFCVLLLIYLGPYFIVTSSLFEKDVNHRWAFVSGTDASRMRYWNYNPSISYHGQGLVGSDEMNRLSWLEIYSPLFYLG